MLQIIKAATEGGFLLTEPQKFLLFSGPEYPWRFFRRWRNTLEKRKNIKFFPFCLNQENIGNMESIDHYQCDKISVKWLGQIDSISTKQLTDALIGTKGKQHIVAFHTDTTANNNLATNIPMQKLQIKIPRKLSTNLAIKIITTLGFKLNRKRLEVFKECCYALSIQLSLENAIEMAEYLELTSTSNLKDVCSYLEQLWNPDHKFFLLPQMLLSGDWKGFFKLWNTSKNLFPQQFWISFWINTLYKISVTKTEGHNATYDSHSLAKIQSKTSNSIFLKNLSLEKIQKAIYRLYQLDCNLKRGTANTTSLDSFIYELI